MTYSVGALVACVAILGDMEKIAVALFIPYVVDFFLQARSGFRAEAFAKVNEDGSLEKSCKGIFHMTHLAIAMLKGVKGKVYERDVVVFAFGLEVILAVLILINSNYSVSLKRSYDDGFEK